MDALVYWKLKATVLQLAQKRQQALAMLHQAEIEAFREAGLDPALSYVLEDATLSAKLVESQPEKQ